MDFQSVADAVVTQALSNLTCLKGSRLLSHVSYPNEDVYRYEITAFHAPSDSTVMFEILASLNKDILLGYTIIDRLGNIIPSLTDESIQDYFSIRDDRHLYYKNYFYIAVKP